ncbi:hypothetical protein CYMTET_34210 [Cymbomonas tetramitiformis]|uniref:Uncharacterized protein n=1 Tax=Cymbomonas tetramitiformis TaxID=36881 RepID=A0AAE0FBM9_9CHLO|nr:hypothetical protein CYMTET_34210 [Cymbomonas tetramitiformis]
MPKKAFPCFPRQPHYDFWPPLLPHLVPFSLGGKRHPAGSTAAYCQPVEDCTTKVLHTLALCRVYQAAADSGKDAFAAAVEQHDAPAVVKAGAASGGVDVSTYGFAVMEYDDSENDELDVHEELRQLRSHIGKAVTFGQASVPPASSLSFAGVSTEPHQQQVVPRHGGAAATDSGVPAGLIARVSVPTEEFPGGVDLVPMRHAVPRTVPSVTDRKMTDARSRDLELEKESEPSQIDILLMASEDEEEEEEFPPSVYDESLVGASGGALADRSQQVPAAVPPTEYWRPEGIYWSQHTSWHAMWYPGPSHPQVVVPGWDWGAPPPDDDSGVPPSPDYDPEEHHPLPLHPEEQPTLNGDHNTGRRGIVYIGDYWPTGMDVVFP